MYWLRIENNETRHEFKQNIVFVTIKLSCVVSMFLIIVLKLFHVLIEHMGGRGGLTWFNFSSATDQQRVALAIVD